MRQRRPRGALKDGERRGQSVSPYLAFFSKFSHFSSLFLLLSTSDVTHFLHVCVGFHWPASSSVFPLSLRSARQPKMRY